MITSIFFPIPYYSYYSELIVVIFLQVYIDLIYRNISFKFIERMSAYAY